MLTWPPTSDHQPTQVAFYGAQIIEIHGGWVLPNMGMKATKIVDAQQPAILIVES